jgi:hypothetical protein
MARSGGASTSLSGADGWMDGRESAAVARSLWCALEKATGVEEKTVEEDEGNGVNSVPGRPRGVH